MINGIILAIVFKDNMHFDQNAEKVFISFISQCNVLGATMRQHPKQEWFSRWMPQTFTLHLFRLFFTSFAVGVSQCHHVAWGTWTPQRLHMQFNSFSVAHQYVPLPEVFLCLSAKSQEHAGDSRRHGVTIGELDRAVESP